MKESGEFLYFTYKNNYNYQLVYRLQLLKVTQIILLQVLLRFWSIKTLGFSSCQSLKRSQFCQTYIIMINIIKDYSCL